ncbi:MAG: hypothetical protein PVS3B3_33490 [Ktedonobacteraceae bacterium]
MITATTDDRTITVLKATALERIVIDGESKPYCAFCPGVRSALGGDVIHHEHWCPTIISRLVLQDLGIPLNLYLITYEVQIENADALHNPRARSQNWREMQTYASGYDTDEIKKLHAMYRNVRIQKVREL